MGTWLVALAAAVMVTGCGQTLKEFACGPEKSCGQGGLCEPSGFCSFEDPSCPSGRRYGDLGGPSGDCTPGGVQQQMDAAIDGPPDARPDAPPDALFCYGTAPISICFATPPAGPKTYSGQIDTMTSTMCAATVSGATDYCVLAGGAITIDARLRATGKRALVLLATDSITVGGAVDVGSHRGANPETGAGADPSSCVTSAGLGPTGGGGGAGGSFAGTGGAGAVSANTVTTGGTPGLPVTNFALRGGCPGQDGDGANKGTGGHGGGAVLLFAVNTIDIQNDITAAGEGGAGATMSTSGGGGGGAGGMIWLDAPTIMNAGNKLVLANSGAGGEGSGFNAGNAGDPGEDSTTTAAASGGHGGPTNGGDGGDGSAAMLAGPGVAGHAGTNTGFNGGGGGGGGGAGVVKARAAANLGNKVSPPITAQ
jgi:hypothetical protein